MENNITKYGILGVKLLVSAAFLAAGLAKLAGADMMVATFDAVGIGQWFRYLTGIIEVAGAILLFTPRLQAIGAGLLTMTMIGAVAAHTFILGPGAMPAIILGLLSAGLVWQHRDQLPRAA